MLDLTQIKLAAAEYRKYPIDQWAALFKAATWEEIKMLAQNNPDIKEAVRTAYRLMQDDEVRWRCEAHEDYIRREKDKQIIRERAEQERDQAVAEKDQAVAEKDQAVAKLELSEAKVEHLQKLLKEHGINVGETDV